MLNRLRYQLGREIELNIITAIKISLKSDSKDSFISIDAFILQSVYTFFRKKRLIDFIKFLRLVEHYYIIGSTEKKENDTSKIILNSCSKKLYEIMFLPKYDLENASIDNKKIINDYIYQIYKSFNKIFFETVKNKDLIYFKKNIEQLDLIFMGENPDLYTLSENLINPLTYEEKENLFISKKAQIYYNQTLLGIKYWIYFLYEKGELDVDLMKDFIKCLENTRKINTFFWEIEYLFSELNSPKMIELYGWNSWDYEEHQEGKFYSSPNVLSWIVKGYAVDSLKKKNISIINVNSEIISENPQNREILIRIIKQDIHKIKANKKWQDYLDDIDDSNINMQLEILEFAFIRDRAREIACTELDQTLIEEYKERFLKVWKENQTIRKIFNYFGKKTEYEGNQKLTLNGGRIYFENGKVSFIKGKHGIKIGGIEDYARQMNVDEEAYFLNLIYESKVPTMYESLIFGIEDSIEKMKDKRVTAIIIDNKLLYKNNFRKLLKESDTFPKYSYKGIPLFTVNDSSLANSFIIANFEEAFTMLYISNEKLLEKELKVDVFEVPDDIITEKLLRIEDQKMSIEDKKNKIMSSVIIDFGVNIKFEINDINAFEIGCVEN